MLLATGTHDALVERIEASLMRVATAARAELLLLTEGRDEPSPGIPCIDLEATGESNPLEVGDDGLLLAELGEVVDDTRWYASARGEPTDFAAIEQKLLDVARTTDRILTQYRPSVVLVWNGLLGARAVVARRTQRRGIPVLYCERGGLPGTWCADHQAVNATSSLAGEGPEKLRRDFARPLPEQDRAAICSAIDITARAGSSAWEQAGLKGADYWRREIGIAPTRQVLFFPLQVNADTNMRFFSPHFADSLAALRAVAEAVRMRPEWFLLVKPHPKGDYPLGAVDALVKGIGRSISDINLHDALALSTLVVTINSTVAAEASWSGKPVLQLGAGILSGKQIVAEFQPDRPLADQLASSVETWNTQPHRFDRALCMYRYLTADHLLQAGDDAHTARLLQRLQILTQPRQTDGALQSASETAATHVWQPARALLDELAARQPAPATVVLVGYGANARRLIAYADRTEQGGGRFRWSAWDDQPDALARAARDGISVFKPAAQPATADTFFVVTPRNAHALADDLQKRGYRRGRDYACLFADARETVRTG